MTHDFDGQLPGLSPPDGFQLNNFLAVNDHPVFQGLRGGTGKESGDGTASRVLGFAVVDPSGF